MNDDTLVAELGATWFGATLAPHARTRLARCASIVEVPAGQLLLREGEETSLLGIVREGRIALRVLVPERGMVTILTVEPGDVVGWSAVVPPYRATSTAIAVEDAVVLALDPQALRACLQADDALAATLYPRILEALARRLAATRSQLLDLYATDRERESVPW